MLPYFREDFGNASSSTHRFGWRAEAAVELAREELAQAIGAADPGELLFTSGATESDNLALQGVVAAARGRHLVTVETEHPAVLDTCQALERRGVQVTRLPVDAEGLVAPAALAAAIQDDTALVSVMAANSEVGSLAPLAELTRIAHARGVLFHCDAAQALGKIPLDVAQLGVDLLSFSGHKLYGPKGIGGLYLRRGVRLAPLLHGGGHERGLRSGTLPVPLVVGLACAVKLAALGLDEERARVAGLRDALWSKLSAGVPGARLNGPPLAAKRLPGNLNVSFDGVRADALLPRLAGIALSTGSACATARPEPSHVLRALGLPLPRIEGALRFGLGRTTTAQEIEFVAGRVAEEVRAARQEASPRAKVNTGASSEREVK